MGEDPDPARFRDSNAVGCKVGRLSAADHVVAAGSETDRETKTG